MSKATGPEACPLCGPVIVIFGAAVRPGGRPSGALRRRVSAALALGQHFPHVCYIPTGGLGRHGPSEASVMAALLREGGVAESSVLLEETGYNTLSSVRAVARMLQAIGYRGRIYAASSDYHLLRCIVLMQLAGLDAWACPPPEKLSGQAQRWFWRAREALALLKDVLLLASLRVLRRWRAPYLADIPAEFSAPPAATAPHRRIAPPRP